MTEADNIILGQLRVIRAEHEKRDRDFALLRAELKMFTSVFGTKLDTLISMMSTQTETLYESCSAPSSRQVSQKASRERPPPHDRDPTGEGEARPEGREAVTDDQVLQMLPEVLRAIQKGIAELKDAQVATRMEISGLGQQVAGLTTAVYAGHDRFAVLEQRIERIERRLELTD